MELQATEGARATREIFIAGEQFIRTVTSFAQSAAQVNIVTKSRALPVLLAQGQSNR
jgi:hypothetical protein